MNFRALNETELSNFATNVATLLTGADLTAIDSHVRDELKAAIGTLPVDLAAQAASAAVAETARKAAVSERNATRAQLRTVLARVRDALRSGMAPRQQYDLCGFDYPADRSQYEAQDPTKLAAFGYSNGVNELRFSGNNKPGRVIYEIWRRQGDSGEWGMHATTKRQSHSDTGVKPGQFYEYKVRAVAAKSVSNFSNTAVVYGAS